jgi:hypothetical protein
LIHFFKRKVTMKFAHSLTAKLLLVITLAIAGLGFQAANAAISLSTVTRTAEMQAIITAAGATGAKLKLYNGCTVPAGVAAATGCTLLATLNWTSVPIGTATGGTIAWDGASVSQTNTSHVAGTPLFAHITTSADVVVARVDICGSAPCWTFTGAVANAQNVTLTGLVFTAGNP